MKNKIITGVWLCFCLSACVMDNYDSPDAQFCGSVIDEDTNTPIQQDMIEGSRIDYVEQGFENPNIRQMRFQTDGTFHENNLFAGTYEIQALRGNFFATEKELIEIKGKTEHTFRTRPYIRIKDVDITFDEFEGEAIAQFTLDQVSGNPVRSVHLIADRNPNLSNTVRSAMVSEDVKAVVSPDRKFKLRLSTETFVSGKEYYFRVAALISDVAEAKHNYSEPVKLSINNSHIIPPVPGKILDACDALTGWITSAAYAISRDDADKKQGIACIRSEKTAAGGDVIFQKTFMLFNTEVTKENGYLAFDFYISDVSLVSADAPHQFELTSGGRADVNEVNWSLTDMGNLQNGWNKVELSLANATDVNLSAVNFLRFYHVGAAAAADIPTGVVFKIDHIRFYSK